MFYWSNTIYKMVGKILAEIGTSWENKVNTIAADALAPYNTRSAATMILNRQDKWNLECSA